VRHRDNRGNTLGYKQLFLRPQLVLHRDKSDNTVNYIQLFLRSQLVPHWDNTLSYNQISLGLGVYLIEKMVSLSLSLSQPLW